MSSWRPALRIARRTVLRSPSRSLLIAILVALPVAGATYADLIARSFNSAQHDAQRAIGSADAAFTVTGQRRVPVEMATRWLQYGGIGESGRGRELSESEVAAQLPAGTRLAAMPRQRGITLSRGERIVRVNMLIGEVNEPLQRFRMRIEGPGHAPGADEVLVSRSLAKRLRILDGDDVQAGASITLLRGGSFRVAGLVVDPACLSCEAVVASPGSAIVRATPPSRRQPDSVVTGNVRQPTYLLDLPAETDVAALAAALAARGIALTTRDALLHPPSTGGRIDLADPDAQRAVALVAIIVALGLLEVVLLAGTAFAVGARRQLRELGLAAAGGASPRDVRRIVLAQGLVLGALGAVMGVAIGFGVAFAGRSLWEHLADFEIPGWEFGPFEIAGAGLVGLFSGLAAAFVPAVGAGRMRAVTALAGRLRVAKRTRRRNSVIGAGLVLAGIVLGLVGAHQLAGDFAAYDAALAEVKRTGRFISAPDSDASVTIVIVAATLAIFGLVALAPSLIGWIARAGGRLPLSARLAVRDAERQRHRTGPATSAIVIAVTGSVLLAFLLAGRFHAEDLRDVPALPAHMIAIERGDTSTAAMLRASSQAAAALPGGRASQLTVPIDRPARGPGAQQGSDPAAGSGLSIVSNHDQPCLTNDLGCGLVEVRSTKLAIGGDDATTRLVAGAGLDEPARRALAAGKALAFDRTQLDGKGRVRVVTRDGLVLLPAQLVHSDRAYRSLPGALISADTARAHGWSVATDSVLVTYAARATPDDVDGAINTAVEAGAFAITDDGQDERKNLVLLLIAGASALVTLIGVAISIALSAAEGRADVATLAAVGAPPGRRRALLACQALLVGGLGCLLGAGLGTFIAYTARATTGSPDFVVPWANLAATGIGVPLLAALVAGACTRGKVTLVRRAD
jgi:putative ABC transport system permease protein